MKEEQLRDIFKATNTSEPLSEGWPGLLRFGRAVAEAERLECAKVCEQTPLTMEAHKYPSADEQHLVAVVGAGCRGAFSAAIRMRSNVEFRPTHAASSREVAPGTEG